MIDRDAAVRFVRAHGSPVELARLSYLTSLRLPTSQVIAALFSGQRPDGSWEPFWAPGYSSLDATCFRLAQAEQLGLLGTGPARQAGDFLAGRQGAAGAWEEDASVAGQAPPWASPGDLAARLYLTANCGFWLAVLEGYASQARLAGNLLEAHLGRDGRLPSFLHVQWLAAGLWVRLGSEPAAGRALDYLLTRLPDLDPGNLAWLLVTLQVAGLPAAHPLVQAAVLRLEHSQAPDGRWANEEMPGQDVHTTLEALRGVGGGG